MTPWARTLLAVALAVCVPLQGMAALGGNDQESEDALTVSIALDQANGTFSPYLAAMSLVYCWARDALYNNGTMASW